jgi:hypothetical protein
MRARAKGVLFATLITLGLGLQGGLCGHYLGYWGALPAMALGWAEGRWVLGRLARRAGVFTRWWLQ